MKTSYNNNVKLWKKAYKDILSVCEKHPNFDDRFSFYDINDMLCKAKNHLMLIDWYEKHGLKLDHSYEPCTRDYISINSYLNFQLFKDAKKCKASHCGRSISWSDDGKQPEDGWLLVISFSTGAYIFGEDYDSQQQLFQDFFKEVQGYKPDYSDTTNKSLYWKIENAKAIYTNFNDVLKKYKDKNNSELKERKAKKMRAELKKIEEELKN